MQWQRLILDFNFHHGNSYCCVFYSGIEFDEFQYGFCEECSEKIRSWIGKK